MKITYSRGHQAHEVGKIYEMEHENFPAKSRWHRSRFHEVVDKHEMWVARHGDLPVGYLIAWKQNNKRSYIAAIAVRKGYQGRGIGAKLITMYEDFYRQRGYILSRLDVDSNNPAQMLYYRLGYRVWKCDRRDHYLAMHKPLI